jgi:hypothetical protein
MNRKVIRRLRKVKPTTLLAIVWNDSYTSTGGWRDIEDASDVDTTESCVSVGYLVSVGKDQVRLAHSVSLGNNDDDEVFIGSPLLVGITVPLGMVTQFDVLGVVG